LICFILLPGIVKASDEVVEKVTVSIAASPVPPSRIGKRMETSVATVGEQMLVGRNIYDINASKASYEKLIKEIFDRVLVGYSVQSVNVVPDSNTVIQVAIAPWGEVVHDVTLETDFGTLSPEIINLIKKDIGNIEAQVNEVFIGLPIDAVDWAGGVSKILIREILADQLPEFRVNFEIIPGGHTVVKLSLTPIGPTVQDVHVSLRSKTIPNLLLAVARPVVDQTSKSLMGLPVAFIQRHQDYFTDRLNMATGQQSIAKRYALKVTPMIYAATDTEIALDVETTEYKLFIEGYMDMGRSKDNTSFQFHAGKFVSKRDEIFMELHFIPNRVVWQFIPGWGHKIGTSTTAGFKYDSSDKREIVWLQQDVNRNISLRLERTPAAGKGLFAVRYKMHDFLSAEYIFTQEDKWLRLIGNL